MQHTFNYEDGRYASAGLELHRWGQSGWERVEPIRLIPRERRLVTKEAETVFPLAYGRKTLRPLRPGAVVDVLDKRTVDGVNWLFVQVNVYDTPLDCFGWLRADATQLLTAANAHTAREVHLRDGAEVYEVREFERIHDTEPGTWHETVAFIEERRDGMVLLTVAGGAQFWTDTENISYPEPIGARH